MTDPRTPMATGANLRRALSETVDLVTVYEADGSFWQHFDYWPDTEPPAPGRDYWVTECTWKLRDDGHYARHIATWQYTPPLRRPVIDESLS